LEKPAKKIRMESSHQKISRLAGRLTIALFFTILLFDYADQSMLSPLINPLLMDFFGSTANVVPLGWITFTFTILSALSMIVAGIFADRKSRVRICFYGCMVYSIFSILTIITPQGRAGYVFFFITRALNGIGIGAIIPTIFSLVGDIAHHKRRSSVFGVISAAMLVGRLAGFVVAGSLMHNWRTAYLLLGITNFVLAFGLLLIREPARGSQEYELKGLSLEGSEYRFRFHRKDIKWIWSNKSNFWLILNFIDVFPSSIIIFLIFKYMKDIHNMDSGPVNSLIFLVVIFGALGALAFGRIGDWGFQKNKRAKVLIALFCNSFPIIFMFLFLSATFIIPDGASMTEIIKVPGVIIMVLAVAAAMFINQGVNPNWYSCLTDINLPEHRATMISLASVMDMIGFALGPLIASYLATHWGLKTAMYSVLFFWGLNVFLWLPVFFHIPADLRNIQAVLKERAMEIKQITKMD
jgi:MFS family permease